jgi:hypothetical protein
MNHAQFQFQFNGLRPVHGLSFDDAIQPIMDTEGRPADQGLKDGM